MKPSHNDAVFTMQPPEIPHSQLKGMLKDLYGFDATLVPLVSERDQNIKVTTQTGRYVLKIANQAEDHDTLKLENAVLAHLHDSSMKGQVPRVLPGINGQLIQTTQSHQGQHDVRLISFLSGELFSQVKKTPALLTSLGDFLGRLSNSLASFGHRVAHRSDFLWNMDNAMAVKRYLADIEQRDNRRLISALLARFEQTVFPGLHRLRGAVVHQDANDNNLIVDPARQQVVGLVDFGDLCFGRQINELAVAMAYALKDCDDLYAASQHIIKGYVVHFSLQEEELDMLFDLIRMRLVMSVCISSHRAAEYKDNAYLVVSQQPAFALLWRMEQINPDFIKAVFRHAAGYPASKHYQLIVDWLSPNGNPARHRGSGEPRLEAANMFDFDIKRSARRVMPLDGNIDNARAQHFSELLSKQDLENAIVYLVGRYGEDRKVYTAEQFTSVVTPEHRSMHLGLDIFCEAGAALYAPLAGRVYALDDNAIPQGFGPTVMLEHTVGTTNISFYTLYGHLSRSAFDLLEPGQVILAGQLIGHIGEYAENGNWAPHLHFQLITDMLGLKAGYHGVGEKSLWPVWSQLCPDPNLITQLADETFLPEDEPDLLARRQHLLGPSLSLSYRRKLHIVRGRGAYLFDQSGRQYLDCVNNICHVGHCHPHVVDALAHQARVLNTNTRYLHQTILDYAERIAATFPQPLGVVYFVNSGTEANELALRIARSATGSNDTIVLDWAYHGNSTAAVEISPYKFKRKGGFSKPKHVHVAQLPDPYRGPISGTGDASGNAYAQSVARCIENITLKNGHGRAVFIAESISGVGGQIVYPDGYLRAAYEAVRAQGGVCIADEVQCGFGRVGTHFWAFEQQQVVPDIVVLGKPIGNGHPLAAVVTTAELANTFANGMEYFNSFGGNPVSTAVGMAVMDVIENENLITNAHNTGQYLVDGLEQLKQQHAAIGDIRGEGFFLGVELVQNRKTKEPAGQLASDVVNRLRENAILLSTDGPFDNVLKFKPPMVFSKDDAVLLLNQLDHALSHPSTD